MADNELMELLVSVYEASGGPSGTQPRGIANAILANPDVVLRALGADFGSDVQDGDTRYLTVHFQWENS